MAVERSQLSRWAPSILQVRTECQRVCTGEAGSRRKGKHQIIVASGYTVAGIGRSDAPVKGVNDMP
jgi:hypothetical protein